VSISDYQASNKYFQQVVSQLSVAGSMGMANNELYTRLVVHLNIHPPKDCQGRGAIECQLVNA
jgi:hypothetical protein